MVERKDRKPEEVVLEWGLPTKAAIAALEIDCLMTGSKTDIDLVHEIGEIISTWVEVKPGDGPPHLVLDPGKTNLLWSTMKDSGIAPGITKLDELVVEGLKLAEKFQKISIVTPPAELRVLARFCINLSNLARQGD